MNMLERALAEADVLRAELRGVITNAGGLAAEGVSDEFLCHAAAEVKSVVAFKNAELVRLASHARDNLDAALTAGEVAIQLRAALRETREALVATQMAMLHSVDAGCTDYLDACDDAGQFWYGSLERAQSVLAKHAALAGEDIG